jgi:hippurate hydrolase
MMAAADVLHIRIQGKGGHGARPSDCADPVVAACGIVQAIQTISSRNHNSDDQLVISVTQIHTGAVDNVIPDTAYINGTVRTFDKSVQAMVVKRLHEIVAGQAASYGVTAELEFEYGYPPTINDRNRAEFAAEVAREVVGAPQVDDNITPVMGAEDFAYLLEARPGAYLFLGQGEGAGLHHPEYNFNDEVAPVGASFFARLVERAQPLNVVAD